MVMKSRWSIAVLTGCFFLIVVVAVLVGSRPVAEPVYKGRPLSQYLHDTIMRNGMLGSYSVDTEEAIQRTEALPWLLSELGRPSAQWRQRLQRWIDTIRRKRPPQTSPEWR